MTITRYEKLKERTDKPEFSYVVLVDSNLGAPEDYYLFNYNEFEKAYDVLKAEAAKDADSLSVICEIGFNNSDRTYYLKPTFKIRDGKIIYDKYQEDLLHVLWHIKAGEWLNPREEVLG